MRRSASGLGPPPLYGWQILLLAFICGVVALRYPLPGAACSAAIWGLTMVLRSRVMGVLPLLAVFALGAGYGWLRTPNLPEVPSPDPFVKFDVRGRVDTIETRPEGRLQIVLDRVEARAGERVLHPGGVALVWDGYGQPPSIGREIAFRSSLYSVDGFDNAGAWDFGAHWRDRGVGLRAYARGEDAVRAAEGAAGEERGSVLSALDGLRRRIVAAVGRELPETPGGAVVLALLTGDRSRLDSGTVDLFRRAGLAHTLALSGLHLGFVVLFGSGLAFLVTLLRPGLLLRVPRRKLAVLLSAPLALFYLWLAGFPLSLVRAALMFASFGLLLLRGRGRPLLDGLFLALGGIVLVWPLAVFDIGLEFSVLAVAAIGLLLPIHTAWFSGRTVYGKVLRYPLGVLAVSLCATIGLLPLSTWYFGVLSPNLLPNLVWLPALGLVVLPLGAVSMLALTAPGGEHAARLGFETAAFFADRLVALLQHAGHEGLLPVYALLRPRWPEILGAGVLLVCVAAWHRRPGRVRWSAVGLGAVLLLLPHVRLLLDQSRDRVVLDVLDVGQGQALCVTLPGGERVLVDGGGFRSRTFDVGRAVVGPALTWGAPPRLNAVALTHPDMDHYKGLLHPLRSFVVDSFFFNGLWPAGGWGRGMRGALEAQGVTPVTLAAGDALIFSDDVRLEVVHPLRGKEYPETNDGSLVMRLIWKDRPLALLMGDAGHVAFADMRRAGYALGAEVLVLPHHGSRHNYSEWLYDAVSPRAAVASCGERMDPGGRGNRVARAFAERRVPLYSTAEDGEVRFIWERGEAVRIVPRRAVRIIPDAGSDEPSHESGDSEAPDGKPGGD